MRSGFVSLVGRPNVGKSTLINALVGEKVAITTNRPQTTRNIIQGIYNDNEAQIVFVDTPGIHKPSHKLGKYLNEQAYYTIKDVDVIVFLVDASVSLGKGDMYILDKIKEENKPIVLAINKIDKLTNEQILKKIDEYSKIYAFDEIVPLAAIKNRNVDELIKTLKKYLNDDYKYYMNNEITNKSLEFMVSEVVREKVMQLTLEEIPHSITCITEKFGKSKGVYNIHIAIIVDREAIKKIIVGASGQKIKQIGILARQEIEGMLNAKVYINLFVKVIPKWRDKDKYLKEFGFTDFEN